MICDSRKGGIKVLTSGHLIQGNYLVKNNNDGTYQEIYVSGSYNGIQNNYIYHYLDQASYCVYLATGSYNTVRGNILRKKESAADYIYNNGASTTTGSNTRYQA